MWKEIARFLVIEAMIGRIKGRMCGSFRVKQTQNSLRAGFKKDEWGYVLSLMLLRNFVAKI